MTSRRERVLRVGADISGALTALDRLRDRGEAVARRLNRVGAQGNRATGGLAGAGLGAVRGGGGGLGRAALAGGGIGAGAAIIERLFESLFELFEGTDVLETFTSALQELLRGAAPIAGVLIGALIEPLRALTPVLPSLARALAPVIELLGGQLTTVITLLAPLVIRLADGLSYATRAIRDGALWVLRQIVDLVNRIPGVDIDLPAFARDTLDDVSADLTRTQARRAAEEAARGEPGRPGEPGPPGDPGISASGADIGRAELARGIAESRLDRLIDTIQARPGVSVGSVSAVGADLGPQAPPPPLTAYVTVEVSGEAIQRTVQTAVTEERERGR